VVLGILPKKLSDYWLYSPAKISLYAMQFVSQPFLYWVDVYGNLHFAGSSNSKVQILGCNACIFPSDPRNIECSKCIEANVKVDSGNCNIVFFIKVSCLRDKTQGNDAASERSPDFLKFDRFDVSFWEIFNQATLLCTDGSQARLSSDSLLVVRNCGSCSGACDTRCVRCEACISSAKCQGREYLLLVKLFRPDRKPPTCGTANAISWWKNYQSKQAWCRICKKPIYNYDRTIPCPFCGRDFHKDCWNENLIRAHFCPSCGQQL